MLNDIISYLQIAIVTICGLRITYCCITISGSPQDAESDKKKVKNAIIFAVIASSITGIVELVKQYFGG